MMPEMDGIEACIKIREIKTLTNTRIIFLSARGEDFTQIAAFDAGADDYITKPVKPKILLKKISSIIVNEQLVYCHYEQLSKNSLPLIICY